MKKLYLEERVSLARNALNEQSTRFHERMPSEARAEFRAWILDVMTLLEGDVFGDATERLFPNYERVKK